MFELVPCARSKLQRLSLSTYLQVLVTLEVALVTKLYSLKAVYKSFSVKSSNKSRASESDIGDVVGK